jgi:hypothetical protein
MHEMAGSYVVSSFTPIGLLVEIHSYSTQNNYVNIKTARTNLLRYVLYSQVQGGSLCEAKFVHRLFLIGLL